VEAEEIYVSRNQETRDSAARGRNEAAYYQTSAERYVSFLPEDGSKGQIFGEAYRGYATEASDGAGGIACTAPGLGKILANLASSAPALSAGMMNEIRTPPEHYGGTAGFDPETSAFYSKGFNVRLSDGRAWLGHGGMTNHCGGVIGHNAGYQFVVVSNWNSPQAPYVDTLLRQPLADTVAGLG